MAVKKVYKIKDEILNDEYEVFGQSGVMQEAGLMLLDFDQMAQYVIENNCKNDDYEYIITQKDISNVCIQWSYEISKIIIDTLYDTIMSDIEDDEELKLEE